jgi:hypothetical protein
MFEPFVTHLRQARCLVSRDGGVQEKFQSEFRVISLENLELKRVLSQQQARRRRVNYFYRTPNGSNTLLQVRLSGQQANSVHRAQLEQQTQSDNQSLQRQLALIQQQIRCLCDHPAVRGSLKAVDAPNNVASFTGIREALDACVALRSALDMRASALQHERAGWQQQLDAASSGARAVVLENEELKRLLAQAVLEAEGSQVRAASSAAAVKFLAEQNSKARQDAAAAQRQLEALSREVQPAFSTSMELRATVVQLQASLSEEQRRAAAAEARCRELEALRSQQREEVVSRMNSAKAAASARLSARVTASMLSDALQQLRSDEVGS